MSSSNTSSVPASTSNVSSTNTTPPNRALGVAAANLILAQAAMSNGKEGSVISLPPASEAGAGHSVIAPEGAAESQSNTSVITLEAPLLKSARLTFLEDQRAALVKEIAEEDRRTAAAKLLAEKQAAESARKAQLARVQSIIDQSHGLTTEELKMAFLGLRDRLHVVKSKGAGAKGAQVASTHRALRKGRITKVATGTSTSKHASRNAVSPELAAKIVAIYRGQTVKNVTAIKNQVNRSRQTIYRYLAAAGIKIHKGGKLKKAA